MKASEYERGSAGEFDDLLDFVGSNEGKAELKEMDSHWREVMSLAERYGFVVNAYGGTATLATHSTFIQSVGMAEELGRLRMIDVEMDGSKR